MSVDILQEKIRKAKNPMILDLGTAIFDVPAQITTNAASPADALGSYCRELLTELKGLVPAVRISFGTFALLGTEGILQLQLTLKAAADWKYYILLDAPEILSPMAAQWTADAIHGENSQLFCDGVIVSGYLGSDVIKPFLNYCKKEKKDLFVVGRTANKSASELQDLLTGSRLVYAVAADHVNRHGGGTAGKYGYNAVGFLGAASSAESLRSLRSKYPNLFLLADGFDYPSANAKNCANAFDKLGHGAAVCVGSTITGAWKQAEAGEDYLAHATAAAERIKKNLARYVTVL